MYKSYGYLQYRGNSCVLVIDKEIVNYYYSLIPRYKRANRQAYCPHITVVRKFEEPKNFVQIVKTLQFSYSGDIYYDETYFYLESWSEDISLLREYYGLKPFRLNYNSYHITLGNTKTLDPLARLSFAHNG